MNDALYKKFAKYYDKLYKNKDYLKEITFVDNIIKKHIKAKRKNLLDVACGTGNHTLLFKRRGYVTTGIDSSSEMLRMARNKNKLIEFIKADMKNFSMKNNFDVIICLFASINYLKNYNDIKETLTNFYNQLKNKGIVIFDLGINNKNLEKYKITIFCIVPSMYVAILSLKEYERFNLSSLRYAVVFGAPSSPMLLKKFHNACQKAVLLNGWGMTETAAPNTFSPPDESKISSIGKFGFKMEAKIINEEGGTLFYGEKGELLVKGAGVMKGYYKESTLSSDSFYGEGWLRTGDIAYLGNDGLLYLAGRKKDMIKVAGEIVFSSEVEEKMYLHPQVAEVAVIGVADEMRGEVPKAFIVAKEGQTIDTNELKIFLKPHLARFKIPHHFEVVTQLPKNRVGKIDKQKLEADERGSSARGGSAYI